MSALSFNLFSSNYPATHIGFEGVPSTGRIVGSRVAMGPDVFGVEKIPVRMSLDWSPSILRVAYHFPFPRFGVHVGSELVNTEEFTSLGVVCTSRAVDVSLGTGGDGVNIGEPVDLSGATMDARRQMGRNLDYVIKQKTTNFLGLRHERFFGD